MDYFIQLTDIPWFGILIATLTVWSVTWKGIALWNAARSNQLGWYIALLFVNTLGILELAYLLFFKKKS